MRQRLLSCGFRPKALQDIHAKALVLEDETGSLGVALTPAANRSDLKQFVRHWAELETGK
jgi:hypothetical protein